MSTTRKLIQKITVASNTGSVNFVSIPQNYTDLVILTSTRRSTSTIFGQVIFRLNDNSNSVYSVRYFMGDGATVASYVQTSTFGFIGNATGNSATTNTYGNAEIYIPNYSSSNQKIYSSSAVGENNASTVYMEYASGLIDETAPINKITLTTAGTGEIMAGSTFYLYGVSNADGNDPGTFGIQATGGDVTISGGYKVHTFRSTGTFTVTEPGWIDYLVVGGGGGGGSGANSGGGGAGGLLTGTRLIAANSYSVIVGAGGAAGASDGNFGSNGIDSSFSTAISFGGGGGGSTGSGAASVGRNGGSGGGGGLYGVVGGSGVAGQGNAGGSSQSGAGKISAGGGGGAGGVGASGGTEANQTPGNGGVGISSSITGTATFYAGGGGGGSNFHNPAPVGGLGGGGVGGSLSPNQLPTSGAANTGGGGGGGASGTGNNIGGAGGSGVVIIRYPVS